MCAHACVYFSAHIAEFFLYFQIPFLTHFVPTLLLWIVSALLPNLVYYIEYYGVGHWTKSVYYNKIIMRLTLLVYVMRITMCCSCYRTSEHLAIMQKTYYFLILMILVLPSLGLTSAMGLLMWLAHQDHDLIEFRWK